MKENGLVILAPLPGDQQYLAVLHRSVDEALRAVAVSRAMIASSRDAIALLDQWRAEIVRPQKF
jgi:hypothetical protein